MIDTPTCSACNANDWSILGQRTYRAAEISTGSAYLAKRLRVLFEVWQPDAETVTLRAVACRICGFVTHDPRASATDVAQKYAFIHRLGSDLQSSSPDRPIEMQRAREAQERFLALLPKARQALILDFGGNDGRLLRGLVELGNVCELCDYSKHTIEGVTKVAETENDLDQDRRYDLIVASHVLEHIADPLATLDLLAVRLKQGGYLYVEVPMEIWGAPPLPDEPVTHVNYFTKGSLRTLLARTGLNVVSCRMGSYLHSAGHRLLCVRAVARKDSFSLSPSKATSGLGEVERYLRPGRREAILRRYWLGRLQPSALARAASRRLLPKTLAPR